MNKIALITGGGSGIGQALSIKLSDTLDMVYIVGRNLDKLKQTQKLNPQKISIINRDVRSNRERVKIRQDLAGVKLDYLVHNAGIMNNVCTFDKIKLRQWQDMQKTNLEAPMFLTQELLTTLKPGSRVLHISSGAAHAPYSGMLCYGISKAALLMLYQGLNLELKETGILFGSFMPGIVDTDIMLKLRSQDPKVFPRVGVYQERYKSGQCRSPNQVALITEKFLCHTDDELFISKDWRIEEIESLLSIK